MPITVRTRQSELRENPWQMLVICQMLNQTSWKQVDQVSPIFFDLWPNPEKLIQSTEAEIAEIIRPLGFYNRRAKSLVKFSKGWLEIGAQSKRPDEIPIEEISSLCGIGKYALDSWKIFQLSDLSVEPTDKVLIEYLKEAKLHGQHETISNTSGKKI